MNPSLTTQTSNRNFIVRKLEQIAEKNFPKRFKRLIYISSIIAIIKQIREPDHILIAKLNDIFKIARYPDAMIFPMYIKSFIWRDLKADNIININGKCVLVSDIECNCISETDYEAIAKYFNSIAPGWLKYGSEKLMIYDVVLLMKHLRDFDNKPLDA